jgi:predicted RNA-binding Zn-ribbon protein involved in translation (DUF1610 family)
MANGRCAPKAAVEMLVLSILEMAAYDPKRTFRNRALYPVKCPSCKSKISSSNYKNDPWSKVDKHGEGFYVCPSCGKQLIHRWAFGPSFFLFTLVAAAIGGVVAEVLASAIIGLIGMFTSAGESMSEGVTFFSYALVAGAICLYVVQPIEVESR